MMMLAKNAVQVGKQTVVWKNKILRATANKEWWSEFTQNVENYQLSKKWSEIFAEIDAVGAKCQRKDKYVEKRSKKSVKSDGKVHDGSNCRGRKTRTQRKRNDHEKKAQLIIPKLWQMMQSGNTKMFNLDKDIDEMLSRTKITGWNESTKTKKNWTQDDDGQWSSHFCTQVEDGKHIVLRGRMGP